MGGNRIPRRLRGIPRGNWALYDMARDAFLAGMSYGKYVARVDPPPARRRAQKKKPPEETG